MGDDGVGFRFTQMPRQSINDTSKFKPNARVAEELNGRSVPFKSTH
jgi:hypothetical protein